MIVTINEVQNWCQRAMAGSGAPAGVDDDAAAAAAWLAARGLPALGALVSALDRWHGDPTATRMTAQPPREGERRFDAAERSAIFLCGALIDSAIAAAASTDRPARLAVKRLADPIFLLPVALGYGRRDWAFELRWRGAEGREEAGARLDQDGPCLLGEESGRLSADPVSLSITCGRRSSVLHGASDGETLPAVLSASDLERRYGASLEQGVEVADDTWAELKAHGMKALVPASAQSRARGAGAAASDNE